MCRVVSIRCIIYTDGKEERDDRGKETPTKKSRPRFRVCSCFACV